MGLLLKLGWMKGRNRHSELDSRKEGRCRDGRREEPGDLVGHLLLWKKGVLLGWILICRDEEQPSIQISTLLFATLYILCHIFLTRFKKPAEFTTVDDADATVNKIALELCTFTLAIALGAVLLLPFSIISNEVLLSLPRNYYIQWLNGSLIHGLWNLVFLFSNLSLIFLMPFAYFFTESEGFAGSRKGVLGRVYETVVMLMLLTLLVLGMVWVASAIVDNNKASRESLYDFWEYYLPYLYSCISFLGVLLLLVCTPLGLARMFSVTGKLLVKPRLLEDLEEQLYCSAFEEAALTRRICNPTSCWLPLDMELLHRQLLALQTQRVLLEKRRKASAWQRNLGYPLAMLCLLVLTIIGNCVCLLVLSSALPVFSRTLGPGTSSRPWEFLGTPVARGGPLLEEKIPDSGSEAEASLAADTLNSPELLVSLPSRIGRGQPISCSVEMWPPGGSTKLDW
ncbi:protein LMBR1L isoform X14 [Papio anubis]|uniref:protein LMBR1L isoform X14 n=1 Tax=Papio anubis TaxID=9555 RepID=UPI0012ADC3CA|nr:protein LMBR1L isoform X14 [Papio anubis]